MRDDEFMVRLEGIQASMLALACRITGSQADAQDALQEAALAAYIARGQLKDPQRFGSWFRIILVHKCGDILRRRPNVVPLEEHRRSGGGSDWSHGRLMWMLVDRLSKPCAQVLVMRYAADLSQKSIAAILDIPLGTVKSRLNRALEQMRAMLQEEEEVSEDAVHHD